MEQESSCIHEVDARLNGTASRMAADSPSDPTSLDESENKSAASIPCLPSTSRVEQANPVATLNDKSGKVHQDEQALEMNKTLAEESEAVPTANISTPESTSYKVLESPTLNLDTINLVDDENVATPKVEKMDQDDHMSKPITISHEEVEEILAASIPCSKSPSHEAMEPSTTTSNTNSLQAEEHIGDENAGSVDGNNVTLATTILPKEPEPHFEADLPSKSLSLEDLDKASSMAAENSAAAPECLHDTKTTWEIIGKRCVTSDNVPNASGIATDKFAVNRVDSSVYETQKQNTLCDNSEKDENKPLKAGEPQEGKSPIECEKIAAYQCTGPGSVGSQSSDWIEIQLGDGSQHASDETLNTHNHILDETRDNACETIDYQVVKNNQDAGAGHMNGDRTAANCQSTEPKSFTKSDSAGSIQSVNPNEVPKSQSVHSQVVGDDQDTGRPTSERQNLENPESVQVRTKEAQNTADSSSDQSQTVIGSQRIEFPINEHLKIECQVVLIRINEPQPAEPSTGEPQASRISTKITATVEPRMVASFKIKSLDIPSTETIGSNPSDTKALGVTSGGATLNHQDVQAITSDSVQSRLAEPVETADSNGPGKVSNADKMAEPTMGVHGFQRSYSVESSATGKTVNSPETTEVSPPGQILPVDPKVEKVPRSPKKPTAKQERYMRFLASKKAAKLARKELAAALQNEEIVPTEGNEKIAGWSPTAQRGDIHGNFGTRASNVRGHQMHSDEMRSNTALAFGVAETETETETDTNRPVNRKLFDPPQSQMGGFNGGHRGDCAQTRNDRFARAERATGSSYPPSRHHGRGVNDILSDKDGNVREQHWAPASPQRKYHETPAQQLYHGGQMPGREHPPSDLNVRRDRRGPDQVRPYEKETKVKDWDGSKEWEESSAAETARPEGEQPEVVDHGRGPGRGRGHARAPRPWRVRRVAGGEEGAEGGEMMAMPIPITHPTATPLNPRSSPFSPLAEQSSLRYRHISFVPAARPLTDACTMNVEMEMETETESSGRAAQSTRDAGPSARLANACIDVNMSNEHQAQQSQPHSHPHPHPHSHSHSVGDDSTPQNKVNTKARQTPRQHQDGIQPHHDHNHSTSPHAAPTTPSRSVQTLPDQSKTATSTDSRLTTQASSTVRSTNMVESKTQPNAVDDGINGALNMNERKSSALSRLDNVPGELSEARRGNNRNNRNNNYNNYNSFNNFNNSAAPPSMANGRPRRNGKSKHRVAASAHASATYDDATNMVPDGTWDATDSFFPATSNQHSANGQSVNILPYNITLKKCPKYKFSEAGCQTAQINALIARRRQPEAGFVGNTMTRNSPSSYATTTNPTVAPEVKSEQTEVAQKRVATTKNHSAIFAPPHLSSNATTTKPTVTPEVKSEPSEVVQKRVATIKDDSAIFVPPHLRSPAIPVPKLSAIQASLKTTSGQNGKSADAYPGTALNGEASNKSGKPANTIPGPASNAEISNKKDKSADPNPADPNPADPNPAAASNAEVSNVLPVVQKSPKGKEPAAREADNTPAPLDSRSNVSKDSQVSTADGKFHKKHVVNEHPLTDWEGNWMAPPIEWGVRPSFDPRDKQHMRTLNAWLQERAGEALTNPVTLDTTDPRFETGEALAAGETVLGEPIDSKLHETKLPDDDFTKAKCHETAADAQKKHRPRVIAEKNEQYSTKAERRSYREALRLARANYVPRPNPHTPLANIYIRPAEAKDLPQITEIYNHYIEHSVVVPEREQHNVQQWRGRWIDATESNFAFIVAVQLSGKGGGHTRRTSHETICGFAYADDFGDNHNAYRFTCELQVYVGNWTLRMGVGKSLVDRMMAALDPVYHARGGAKFNGGDDDVRYQAGGVRVIHKVMLTIPYAAKDDSTLKWQKEWLSQWHFEQVSMLPGIGRKFDKVINVAQLMMETGSSLPMGI